MIQTARSRSSGIVLAYNYGFVRVLDLLECWYYAQATVMITIKRYVMRDAYHVRSDKWNIGVAHVA